jgi:hypothetical protein
LVKKLSIPFSVFVQALIIRDFRGVDPRLYHEAIAAQAVACPRTPFNVERQFASPTTGDTPKTFSERRLTSPTTGDTPKTFSERCLTSPTTDTQNSFDPPFTSTQIDKVPTEKLNDSEDFFQTSVSLENLFRKTLLLKSFNVIQSTLNK